MLDGAEPCQRFRLLILPMLATSTFFLVITNAIYLFQAFNTVYVLTGGGPRNTTSLLVTYAYATGFGLASRVTPRPSKWCWCCSSSRSPRSAGSSAEDAGRWTSDRGARLTRPDPGNVRVERGRKAARRPAHRSGAGGCWPPSSSPGVSLAGLGKFWGLEITFRLLGSPKSHHKTVPK